MHRLPRALVQQPLRFARQPVSRTQIRRATQYLQRPGEQPLRYQAVRIDRPGFFANRRVALRRILSFLIYGGATYVYLGLVMGNLDIGLEEDDEEEQDAQSQGAQHQGVEEAEEEEGPPFYADENSIFIPLTWAKKLPRVFYRGSDPEWQEFMKFANDKSRRDRAKQDLADRVLVAVTRHPQLKKIVGDQGKIRGCWVDYTYPPGPPQEYERSGIEIGDGFIAWSQQKVDADTIFRLSRALWPSAALGSLWNATSVLAGIQYRRAKQAMGLEDKDPKNPEEQWKLIIEAMAKKQQGGKPVERASPEVGASSPTSAIAPSQPKDGASDTKRLPWLLSVPMPGGAASGSLDISLATYVFRANLARAWNDRKKEPPRGTCVVIGIIEVLGDQGRATIDAKAFYEPKTSQYTETPSMSLRHVAKHKQRPRGGP